MRTRDGVTLRADVYRPDAPGRFPVLLSRLPYDKKLRRRPGDIDVFVEHGYVVIMQDTRGRFASDGDEYYPLIWEADDGYDAVEWAAALPYADGQVGTMGQSYLGATQYLLAPTRPPHLTASFPASAPADFHQSWVYHSGGAFELGWQIPYAILMARDTIARRGLGDKLLPELERELAAAPTPWAPPLSPAAYRRLPLMAWAEQLQPVARYLSDYLRQQPDGPAWWPINVERRHDEIAVPMYHVTSWYDIFLHGGIANFRGLRDHARTESARAAQKLLIGPWAHLFPYTSPTSTGTGDIDFGPTALIDLHDIQLRWFDHWLKGIDTGILEEPPVKIFVMGENRWRDEHEWPLGRTRYTPYYIHSAGRGNTASGDGVLHPRPPGDEPPDQFVYDPGDPVPTRGGNTLIIAMGVQDQRPVETRDDVLVYSSEPLTEALDVTGPLAVTLYAASSAPDTDFTAKLVDVRPDGYAQNLADGIVRARYRESRETPALLTPGQVSKFTIDLWATSHVFKPGHRIRLEVSSSNFPRFDRNLNTGEDPATGTRWQTARQTVFHDQRYPSHIVLP
ncbi:MAG TPA: CocE/NonD family hydrolase, partial [Methylomirabilota bacterium]|nr:CocE/NonD family hydrolase [Methylomirabilota bacterium]